MWCSGIFNGIGQISLTLVHNSSVQGNWLLPLEKSSLALIFVNIVFKAFTDTKVV